MNEFLTIMCFALVAYASAKPGYNYQQPKQIVKQIQRPAASISNSGIYSIQQSPPLTSFNVQSQQQSIKPNYIPPLQAEVGTPQVQFVSQQQYAAPVSQYATSSATSQYAGTASGGASFSQAQQQTIISKDIYIHSAPEETEEINHTDAGSEPAPVHKNYRILFIKAPVQNLRLNLETIKRAQAANEEKTIIYVLSKKPDIAKIQNQLVEAQTEQKANKPEVYFIKYKTQEEANRAQQEIQAQYDALGGSTHISDEGIAPVTSVIGGSAVNVGSVAPSFATAGSAVASTFATGQQQFVQQSLQGSPVTGSSNVNFGIEGPSTKYLPAKKK